MAKTKRRVSRTKQLEKSLRDAQSVLAGYIDSGGKQVKSTIGALLEIFDSRHFADALSAPRRMYLKRTARRRAAAKRTTARRGKAAGAARSVRKIKRSSAGAQRGRRISPKPTGRRAKRAG